MKRQISEPIGNIINKQQKSWINARNARYYYRIILLKHKPSNTLL